MSEKNLIRKLRAILSADVKGYSLLMANDEIATIHTITTYRAIMQSQIEQHKGRVVDSPGDNLLAEFPSVVDAVQCAIEIQKELKVKNDELPTVRRMDFRIGVNLGDIIQEGNRIYGDGVNVAARIESLADPGGISISGTAFDSVRNKLGYGFKFSGEQKVKNIANPIRHYKILMDPEAAGKVIGEKQFLGRLSRKVAIATILALAIIAGGLISHYIYLHQTGRIEPASVKKMAFPLPDKPSIAVLPFDNMSDDPEQEYFSDGLAEEIINGLSKTDQLLVIARNSTFTYKGKPVKVKQIAEDLGVRYVLEGSVRKSKDRVRVTAQLIDSVAGHHLWSERYDRNLHDIFAVQDELTMKIMSALQVKLTEGEQARIWSEKYDNIDVYLKAMELLSLGRQGTKESHLRYGQLAQELIETAPEHPVGYRGLARYYWDLTLQGVSPRESIAKALKFAQKAISLNDSDALSEAVLSSVYVIMRQYEKAIASGSRAVALNPNMSLANAVMGMTLSYADKPDDAIGYFKQAMRLDPFPPYWYFYLLGRCYIQKGQYEEALVKFKQALQRAPDAFRLYLGLAVVYVLMERQEEAEAAAKRALELYPNYSVARASKTWPFKNQAYLKKVVDALHKAGLK